MLLRRTCCDDGVCWPATPAESAHRDACLGHDRCPTTHRTKSTDGNGLHQAQRSFDLGRRSR